MTLFLLKHVYYCKWHAFCKLDQAHPHIYPINIVCQMCVDIFHVTV